MKFVSGITPSERRLVCALQRVVDSKEDNSLGPASLVDIAIALDVQDLFPLCVDMYNAHIIVCKDFLPAKVAAPLKNYARAISGSFSWAEAPCSFLISGGTVKCGVACHYWTNGCPETVLYKTNDGKVGIRRARTTEDLPEGIKYATGGMGLCTFYDPAADGFIGRYVDALRKTDHTVIGYKNGYFFLCYVPNATAKMVNQFAQDKMKFEYAIMLDGGGPAAINNEEIQINTRHMQYYIVQGV